MNKKSPEKCAFRMNRGERDQKKKKISSNSGRNFKKSLKFNIQWKQSKSCFFQKKVIPIVV